MQQSWQTENKLAATQYPLVKRSVRVAAEMKTQARLPYPDPKSTLAGHLCTGNRFHEKEPFPPCDAADFSYRGRSAPSCAEPLGLPDEPTFANRFLHQITAEEPMPRHTTSHDATATANFRRIRRRRRMRRRPTLRLPPKPPNYFAVSDPGDAENHSADACRQCADNCVAT